MDFLAPPPRPPNELNKMNEILDYVFIDSGSPDSYLNADSSILNDSFINATLFNTNSSSLNVTESVDEPVSDLIIMAITSMILGLMILVTVIGNVFVIAAIILERHLQNVANYLVASLAVADLFVACLVMPLGAVYEISKGWILGPELCDIWTSCDVLCCTASILHLVAIALDRYWAVTNVDYMHTRTSTRVFTMIFLVWFISIFVSLAPQFGWKDPEYLERIEQKKCMVSQDLSYQVFATCCTFYVPLLVILVLYWKIYQTARKRIHRRRPKLLTAAENSQEAAHKTTIKASKSRLPFSLSAKFSKKKSRSAAVSSLGLVDGNSTNTMNTVEDDSNTGEKAKGIEITTTFNVAVDMPTSSSGQLNTVSHQVANKIIVIENDTCNNNHANGATTNGNGSSGECGGLEQVASTQNQLSIHPQPSAVDSIRKSSSSSQLPQLPSSQLSTPLQQHKQNSASTSALNSTPNPYAQINKRKETLEAKRERKAAKTLAIITGAFVVCWLPFFLMAIILPLCEACYISDNIAAFFLWLGYLNSLLNPVIYTVFSPEFRAAFKRILFGTHNKSTYRRGKL